MTIERIAAELRDGEVQGYLPGRIALHAHLADVVALRRIPPLPEDGPRTRERFLEMWRSEAATYDRALDDFHQEDVEVHVEDDHIVLRRTLCARSPEGPVRVPLQQTFTVAGDQVVAIDVEIDPADSARMRALIEASGLPHADVRQPPRRGG